MSSLFIVLLLAAPGAFAKDAPRSGLRPDAPAYASREAAAIAALREAMPLSGKHEFAGAVVESQGRFFFTEPVTNGSDEEFDVTILLPQGYRVAALFHTHPTKDSRTRLFSAGDIEQAKTMGVVSYIGVMSDRTIRFFDPFTTPVQRDRRPGMIGGAGFAEGAVVAYDIPTRQP